MTPKHQIRTAVGVFFGAFGLGVILLGLALRLAIEVAYPMPDAAEIRGLYAALLAERSVTPPPPVGIKERIAGDFQQWDSGVDEYLEPGTAHQGIHSYMTVWPSLPRRSANFTPSANCTVGDAFVRTGDGALYVCTASMEWELAE